IANAEVLRIEAALAAAVPPAQPDEGARRAPRAVVQKCVRHEHDAVPRLEQAVAQVVVVRGGVAGAGAEALVEPPDLVERASPEGAVPSGEDIDVDPARVHGWRTHFDRRRRERPGSPLLGEDGSRD